MREKSGGTVSGFGLVALRLALAVVFVAHGTNILFGLWAGPGIGAGGLDLTAQTFAAAGLAPAFLLAVLVGIIETVGGILLAIGFLTRASASALAVIICVAMWKVHWSNGFFLNWMSAPGRGLGLEFSVVLIGALLCLGLMGAGEWSVDGRREASRAERRAGRARIRRRF